MGSRDDFLRGGNTLIARPFSLGKDLIGLEGLATDQIAGILNTAEAFKEIHDGTCSAPKIILIP